MGFVIHESILTALKDVKFINDRMSYAVFRGAWYNLVFFNVHCPTEEKEDDIKNEFYDEFERVYDSFPSDSMKIILGDFNAKIGKETVFKSTIGMESLHENSNDKGVRLINFARSKHLVIKSTCFKHKDIHKQTWESADGRTFN